MKTRKRNRSITMETSLSRSYEYGGDSSYLDEAFSLLYKQFVGDCSSVESELNESEHHTSAVAWNAGEVKTADNNMIFEPVLLAHGKDNPIHKAACASTTFSRRFLKPHGDSSLTTSFTTNEVFNLDDIEHMLDKKEIERDEDTCNAWDRNVISDHAIVGNRMLKSHNVNKLRTKGANFPRCDEETCSLQNIDMNDLENATVKNYPIVPLKSKIPYAKNKLVVPVMSKTSHKKNAVRFSSCHSFTGTCNEMQHNGNPFMTSSPENKVCPSFKKFLPMMKINPSTAMFPSKYAGKNALPRDSACNSDIKALGVLNFTQTNGRSGSADPHRKKRKIRQVNQGGSQKNGFPKKAKTVMRMRMIERHGLKTRIVMESCIVHE